MSKRTISIFAIIIFSVFTFTAIAQDSSTKKVGFDLNNLDRSVSPVQNFYKYAIGGWLKNNPIPDDQTRWGAFSILAEENNKQLRKIIDQVSTNRNWPKGSAEQKIGDFYATGMDSARIERDGYKPILPDLKAIDALQNKKDLIKHLAEMHLSGTGALFNFFVRDDAKKSSVMAPYLYQGGLGLPDVEYYTKDDNRSKEIRDKYLQHVANMFKLTNVDAEAASNYAQTILNVETQLAKASNTRVENRDPEKNYNKMTINNLKQIAGGFDWDSYFQNMGVEGINLIVVAQPKFITAMSNMIDQVSLKDWKIYLKWNVIRDAAGALSSPFVNERFDFTQRYLAGAKAMQPRWKRIIGAVNGTMGELLGQIYVKEYFPPEAKARAQKIVSSLLVAMGESIKGLEWMSDATKQQALFKLSKFGVKIGYPDKWKDYSALDIERDSYVKNLERASKWARQVNLAKIGKPVEKAEWGMTPQTVNASYNPTRNDITFPAAILQPPFFNQYADDAINYGAMGAVIGHEISHGFDDQGRKYDADGNIKDWWTKEDADKFKVRAQKLVNEYNNFVVVDTFKVNGSLTLGENIGDLGGLTISFEAFKNTDQYKKGEMIDGFTPAQRFFFGWAQVWATNTRPETMKLLVKTDVHSPSEQRVIGPLQNLPEFFKAFDVKPGDPMRSPDDKIVKIW
ncbi:MAG: M13 family metallopeptidase [Ignavibacteriales bacterium]|nr:M13 family metallopeptidase [Ignavibacteriales bacterium]